MHELALVQGILQIVESEARKQSFTRVEEITLKIGQYSGVIPECIREFFPLAAKDTPAEGAELVMETLPAEFECPECGAKGLPDKSTYCCPQCGSPSIKMISGREFFVESLKVE